MQSIREDPHARRPTPKYNYYTFKLNMSIQYSLQYRKSTEQNGFFQTQNVP